MTVIVIAMTIVVVMVVVPVIVIVVSINHRRRRVMIGTSVDAHDGSVVWIMTTPRREETYEKS